MLKFNGSVGMIVVRRFFGRPRHVSRNMIDIEGLSLGFDNPSRNCGIFQTLFVEVKDGGIAFHLNRHVGFLRLTETKNPGTVPVLTGSMPGFGVDKEWLLIYIIMLLLYVIFGISQQ